MFVSARESGCPQRDTFSTKELAQQILMHVEERVNPVGGGIGDDPVNLVEIFLIVLALLWFDTGPHDAQPDQIQTEAREDGKIVLGERCLYVEVGCLRGPGRTF